MPTALLHYRPPDGGQPVDAWLSAIRDVRVKVAIERRLNRLLAGNPGDCKYLRDGIKELRVDLGPGYRLYFADAGDQRVILLAGGDKSTQKQDIETALTRWKDWKHRTLS